MDAPIFQRPEPGMVTIKVDLRSYRLTALKKSAYRFAKECTVLLGAVDGAGTLLTFLLKPGTGEGAERALIARFFQDLLDQELRELIAEETGPIRNLILAQAFSKTDLIRRPAQE